MTHLCSSMIYQLKVVILQRYVKLPEGKLHIDNHPYEGTIGVAIDNRCNRYPIDNYLHRDGYRYPITSYYIENYLT